MSDEQALTTKQRVARFIVSVLLCGALLAGAAFALMKIYGTEPKAEQEGATRRSAALVETVTVSHGTYTPRLVVLGTVHPEREITLSSRVSGEIVFVNALFLPGAVLDADQPLIEIESADYENTLALRQSELAQAQALLAIEEGRQAVARAELEALGEPIDDANRALVLREPQIASIRAEIAAAQAAVAQAELDLRRTHVATPFHGQIIERYANLGSQVSVGEPIARLVGVDRYWVHASVPMRSLARIDIASQGPEGSPVELRMPTIWEPGVGRTGEVAGLVGDVDRQTRMANVLVEVEDPLALRSDLPPLLLGTIVELTIQGRPIEDVVRLPRAYLRVNDTVWVLDDGKLSIRQAEVVFRDSEYAYISAGVEDGDEVVTTALSTVADGAPLRRVGDTPSASDTQPNAEAGE